MISIGSLLLGFFFFFVAVARSSMLVSDWTFSIKLDKSNNQPMFKAGSLMLNFYKLLLLLFFL